MHLLKEKPRYHIEIEKFLDIPLNLYWKDVMGSHLGCNDYTAEDTGLRNCKEYIGLNIYDISDRPIAEQIARSDQAIVNNKQPQCFIENSGSLRTSNNTYLSIKSPLFHDNGDLAGLIGVSIKINEFKCIPSLQVQIPKLHSLFDYLLKPLRKNHCLLSLLTAREKEVIRYLSQGKTTKQIAQAMNLACRTVETHVENIKAKWKCKTATQLVIIALKSGIEEYE